MRLTENMILVLKALASREDGKGYAVEVLADPTLKGKTYNGVNATLAAAAGKGLVVKAKGMYGEKLLTQYTITTAGRNAIEDKEEDAE